MYSVEISLDKSLENLSEYEDAIDAIFARYDLPCARKERGERVYTDRGEEHDYGKLWASVFRVSDTSWLSECVTDSYWVNLEGDGNRERLTDDLFGKRR